MRDRLLSNLLPLTLLLAVAAGWVWPAAAAALGSWHAVRVAIVFIFLAQGATLDGAARFERVWLGPLAWGAVVSQVLGPLAALGLGRALGWEGDRLVGFVLIGTMAPTLVSGTVSGVAAGAVPALCLLLTVSLNLVAPLLVPASLRLTLGATVDLPFWRLLLELAALTALPALAGRCWRRRWPAAGARHAGVLRVAPVVLLGLTIFVALGGQRQRLGATTTAEVLALIAAALAVHYALFAAAWAGGRWLGGALPVVKALAFVCAQKTLPVAVVVWSSTGLAAAYPLAILPPVVFHLSQIYADGLLAWWLARRGPAVRAGGATPAP